VPFISFGRKSAIHITWVAPGWSAVIDGVSYSGEWIAHLHGWNGNKSFVVSPDFIRSMLVGDDRDLEVEDPLAADS
jgi:hypothetical protein